MQEKAKEDGVETDVDLERELRQKLQFVDIERMMKKFKTHRCALDFDSGFVNAIMRETTRKRK